MHDRAIKKLKTLLNRKGYGEECVDRKSYELFHFHIEAFDNKISLNKFVTKPKLSNSINLD